MAWAAAIPAAAGTVEIVLRDENGAAVPRAIVALRTTSGTVDYRVKLVGETDAAGRVTLVGVAPGSYHVTLRGDVLSTFVAPEDNPRVPAPQVTLAEGEDLVRTEIELWHGVPVFCRVVFEGRETRAVTIRFHEIDEGSRFDKRLSKDTETLEQLLLPGRWEIGLEPPPGFLLRDVEIDGVSFPGSVARLELAPGSPPSHLAWYFTEPARLFGRVTFDEEKVAVRIEAVLREPGSWIEAALARGGSEYRNVWAGVDVRGDYSMVLPDGRFSVKAVGPDVDSSDPPSVELTLAAGEERRQDFRVSGAGGSGALTVRVLSPDGKHVEGAVVEVWPLEPEPEREQPVARATSRFAFTMIPDVPAGDWRVAAAREGFLEGSTEFRGFDPEEDPSKRSVTVELREGAALHAVARDGDRQPVAGIGFALEPLDEAPPHVVRDPELTPRLLAPRAESDATGHASMRGVWPGRYALTGSSSARADEPLLVRFRESDRLVERLELDLGDATTTEVEAVLVAAARITGHLACRDGVPLVGLVSVAAIDIGPEVGESDPESLIEGARFRVERVPLQGRLHDTFTAGPLEDGFWLVAVRPEGHDRWTWAPGVEHPAQANRLQAIAGEPTELGTLPIDCGPAIRLVPRVVSGQALPDLRLPIAEASAVRVAVTGSVVVDGEPREIRDAVVDLYRDHVRVRGLPEGPARLELTLFEETFLPSAELRAPVTAALERGRMLDVAVEVAAIGGALVVSRPAATWVRLTAPEGEPHTSLSPPGEGPAFFPSLPPGSYGVAWCADAECGSIVDERKDVQVEAHRTLRIAGY